ncbi:uncharacterized protein BJ212DRAFT_1302442 [Suillus subaureus]|uniref:Uncharacterized protein n=1 Tax=Suillus subaureus TaxID=48587 RepID=A0A9P7E2B4_9AGAM|nr:uncharacterized protein BJ212DRAFT_1302442 [Suillus subaureus]KAG1809592.1 hypothetical protein BJ212DRAFT_1302442 [Suillus subaureus]
MKITKPAQGSSLNLSHAPVGTQINLPNEQPQPPAQVSNFNPHQWQHHLDAHNYPTLSNSNPPSASFNNYLDSFGTSCANSSHPDSSSSSYSSARTLPILSRTCTFSAGLCICGLSAPSWVSDDEEFQALLVPPPDLQHLQPMLMGEISNSHVMHAVVIGYSLFPPQGCDILPDTFHVDWVWHLIVDNPLAFMHQHSLTTDSALIIHMKFNNPFILHILAKLIWNHYTTNYIMLSVQPAALQSDCSPDGISNIQED